ncbi:MAG: DUF2007 domain-containing protein [Bacteroidota bacterium]
MFCPNCKAEYVEGIKVCTDCEVELVDQLPDENIDHEENVTFIPLLATRNMGDIAIIKSLLDEQGIEYFIQGENMLHVLGSIDSAILNVKEDQADEVKELLKDFEPKFLGYNASESSGEGE